MNDFHDPHLALDATIAALVAADALRADDPIIDNARAVLDALRPGNADPAAWVPRNSPRLEHRLLV